MSENDFETRQMCRSPQCVSQHHLGLEAGCPRRCILELFRTRANFFSLLCLVELLLLLLLLLLQLGQNPAQFLRDIWLMFPNEKRGLYWSSVLIILTWVFLPKKAILCWFWNANISLGSAQKLQESAIISDNFNPILHSVCCCSSLANSPHVQSHVHSPTDRNVLCTRAKHVEAYGSWLRCDGGAE